MSAKLNSDPHFARYQSTGAVISLEELLIQRHAAKNLDYLAIPAPSPVIIGCTVQDAGTRSRL